MRVGAHLGPMYEILMGNLPWNFDILCMKQVTSHKSQISESISGGAKFWFIFSPAIRYIKDRHGGLRCDLRCCLYSNNHIT